MAGIGPSSTTVGDHVGTLGAEHFFVAIFVVVVAKLFIVCHFFRAMFPVHWRHFPFSPAVSKTSELPRGQEKLL